jgi:hypothetical protein
MNLDIIWVSERGIFLQYPDKPTRPIHLGMVARTFDSFYSEIYNQVKKDFGKKRIFLKRDNQWKELVKRNLSRLDRKLAKNLGQQVPLSEIWDLKACSEYRIKREMEDLDEGTNTWLP